MPTVKSPAEIAASLVELWSPRIIGELDDNYMKVAKVQGTFGWHAHPDEDELFYILKGSLHIELEDGAVDIGEGQCFVVPKGVRHNPSAGDECHLMLIEKKATLHSGDTPSEHTRSIEQQLRPVDAIDTAASLAPLAARRVATALHWHDLVLPESALQPLHAIAAWHQHAKTLASDWNLGAHVQPGYASLFEGPPGTGKTMAALVLGQYLALDVYRIDLSAVAGKYIGETEKNLGRIFDRARDQGGILLFDDADALFHKRSTVTDSHDRYANIEVSYLLQRMESHPGIVILTSNRKADIDEAFLRRLRSIIHFPLPDAQARRVLWQRMAGGTGRLSTDVDLDRLAADYPVSGADIASAVQEAALQAIQDGRESMDQRDLTRSIGRVTQPS